MDAYERIDRRGAAVRAAMIHDTSLVELLYVLHAVLVLAR